MLAVIRTVVMGRYILHGWMYGSSADLSYFSTLPDLTTEGTAHELFP